MIWILNCEQVNIKLSLIFLKTTLLLLFLSTNKTHSFIWFEIVIFKIPFI